MFEIWHEVPKLCRIQEALATVGRLYEHDSIQWPTLPSANHIYPTHSEFWIVSARFLDVGIAMSTPNATSTRWQDCDYVRS